MIRDLAAGSPDAPVRADYLVIGAGIAGLLLASELRQQGRKVVLLESGGAAQHEPVHRLNEVAVLAEDYRGATLGRFRCLGGTSTRWGGALIPMLEADIRARPHIDCAAWPVEGHELLAHLPAIERTLGVDGGSYEEQFVVERWAGEMPTGDPDFLLRFAKWPVFKRRNFANLYRDRLECDPELDAWLNATVCAFRVDREAGRLAGVTAREPSGRSLEIEAHRIIVCAGAIESTRLLLLLDRQNDGRPFAGCTALGRYFNDHLSLPMAELIPARAIELNRLAAFRFVGSTMRSLRFELSPSAQAVEGVASAFGHISFEAIGPTGFDAVRDVLRNLQQTGRFEAIRALSALRDIHYLVRTAAWRYLRHQLFWPSPARYFLHAVGEQLPRRENRILLGDRPDALGVPGTIIDWRRTAADMAPLDAFRRRFEAYWTRSGLARVARLEWRDPEVDTVTGATDIYHPCSSTRLGLNGRDAVLDRNLRVFGINNLWVASTSAFPSAASANPTLMLMLLTLRLAAHLSSQK